MGLKLPRSLRALFVVSSVAVVFSACQQPTQITLEITTDLACTPKPETAIIVGTTSAESETPGTVTENCKDGRIGAIVLLPKDSKEEKIFVRVVTGVGAGYSSDDCLQNEDLWDDKIGGKGCIIARRTLNFIPRTPLFLPIKMRSVCIGTPCTPGFTCIAPNDCAPATVEDPESCADPDGCLLPGEDIGSVASSSSSGSGQGGSGSSGMGGAGGMGGAMSSSSSSSSSSGMGGAGGMGGVMGSSSSSSSSNGMGGAGGMGGMMGSSSSSSSSTGMGGAGGMGGMMGSSSSSSSGMGGAGGMGGMMGSSSSSSSNGMGGGGGLAPTADGGMLLVGSSSSGSGSMSGGTLVSEDWWISPGYLIVGDTSVKPRRRIAPVRQLLRLPVKIRLRNVKP